MAFDPLGKLKDLKTSIADAGVQKAQDVLSQINLLLKQLQEAGYEVDEMEAQLSVPPEITIHVKTGPAVSDSKLLAAYQANQNNDVVGLILGSLVQANKLRESVNVDTIELTGSKIALTASPSITLEWKEKARGKGASA